MSGLVCLFVSALVSVSVPRNIPIETSSSRCHLEIKARGVVFVILVCGLKHQNMPSAILYSFSYGGHLFAAISFLICQCLDLCSDKLFSWKHRYP